MAFFTFIYYSNTFLSVIQGVMFFTSNTSVEPWFLHNSSGEGNAYGLLELLQSIKGHLSVTLTFVFTRNTTLLTSLCTSLAERPDLGFEVIIPPFAMLWIIVWPVFQLLPTGFTICRLFWTFIVQFNNNLPFTSFFFHFASITNKTTKCIKIH